MSLGLPRCESAPEELVAPAGWHTLDFISDLHLQAPERATFAVWRNYMQRTQASALFILGDLFEVWVGDDAIEATESEAAAKASGADDAAGGASFEAECCAILRATAQRLPVYFMVGNRDFLAGAGFARACGLTLLADPTVLVFAGQRVLLSHGDQLCVDDVDYQRFRAQARAPAWQQRFLAQPLPARRAQARGMRAQSSARKQAESSAGYADVDDAAARAWLRAAKAQWLLHGHTHRPGAHALAPEGRRVVLSDWDLSATPPRAEVLRLDAQGFARHDLTREASPQG